MTRLRSLPRLFAPWALLLSAPEPAPFFALLAPLLLVSPTTHAQLGYERLLHASDEPQNWLTYSGSYASQR
jgi:hypothetical protein